MLANMFSTSLLSAGMMFLGASVAMAGDDQNRGQYGRHDHEDHAGYLGGSHDGHRDGHNDGHRDGQNYPGINGHYTPFSPEIFSPYGRTAR